MANEKFSALPASSTITGAETTIGLQSGAAVQFSPYTTQTVGDASLNLATMQALAEGLQYVNPASAVDEATAAVLPNTPTYSNGTAGVGATLTSATNTALVVDGITVALNDRVLVKNQASTFQNGVYTQTQVGTGSVPWILTRATDYNTPTNINLTGTVPVIAGTVNALTNWLLVSTIAAIGSPNAITYVQQTTGGSSGGGGSSNVKGKPPFTKNELLIGLGGNSLGSLGAAGTAQQVLYGGTPPTFGAPVTENTQTSSYQLVLGDSNNLVNMAVTGAATLTIPANASVAFPVGTIIGVTNTGGGVLTIAITSDALNQGIGGVLVAGSVIAPVGSVYSLVKTGTTTWLASGNQGAPARIFIGSQTVSGSSTSAVTFSSGIPAGYNNLIARIHGRTLNTADASGGGNFFIQLNGDTTSGNYNSAQYLFAGGATVQGGAFSATANGVHIGLSPNSYNSSTQFGSAKVEIFNYNQTAHPVSMQSVSYGANTTGSSGLRVMLSTGTYVQSAVITQVTFTAYNDANNSTANWAAGTLIELYAEL